MTAQELFEELGRQIQSGELPGDAIVVRPVCNCDLEHGWVEARFLDQVQRTQRTEEEEGDGWHSPASFSGGMAEAVVRSALTVKLG